MNAFVFLVARPYTHDYQISTYHCRILLALFRYDYIVYCCWCLVDIIDMPVHGVDLEDGTFNRLSKRTFQVSMWTRVHNRQEFHDREGARYLQLSHSDRKAWKVLRVSNFTFENVCALPNTLTNIFRPFLCKEPCVLPMRGPCPSPKRFC